MKTYAITISKGGDGKTTTATALAYAAARDGLRVLAVDLDPQGHFTKALRASTGRPGAFELLQHGQPVRDCIQPTEGGIDVIAGGRALSTVTSSTGSARRLQKALDPVRASYDLCVIDTPATGGELQYNALQAADYLLAPMQTDINSLDGLAQTLDTVGLFRRSNPALQLAGVVITRYNGRSNVTKQLRETIIQQADALGVPYLGTIREAVAIKEAALLRANLFEHAPRSNAAADYMELYKRLNINDN